jgi:3',5'-cyclic AMP phosphodiesterase CpdA
MRILHISDIHFGGEDGAAIAAVTHFVSAERPDLIVASGDLSAIGLETELRAACDWLASLGPPVIATPGNHDVPYMEILPRFYRPFRRYYRANKGRLLDGWAKDDLFIHTINTARGWQLRPNWALGAVSPRQLHEACDALEAAPAHALKVVVTHHPLLFPPDSPIPGQTHGGKRAARKMIEAGADLFLSGHLHVLLETRVRGPKCTAVALSSGTLSVRLRGEPASFLMIDHVAQETIAVTRYAITEGEVKKVSEDSISLESMPA